MKVFEGGFVIQASLSPRSLKLKTKTHFQETPAFLINSPHEDDKRRKLEGVGEEEEEEEELTSLLSLLSSIFSH